MGVVESWNHRAATEIDRTRGVGRHCQYQPVPADSDDVIAFHSNRLGVRCAKNTRENVSVVEYGAVRLRDRDRHRRKPRSQQNILDSRHSGMMRPNVGAVHSPE